MSPAWPNGNESGLAATEQVTDDSVRAAFSLALDKAGIQGAKLGVAVSGGGDSVALLLLSHAWSKEKGCALRCATVNHRLRDAADAEARFVASLCRELGVEHETLSWDSAPASGNLQGAARDARRELIGSWARLHGLGAILLGHTRDDQAETFLMRLGRGSGVDGLASMYPVEHDRGVDWIRPLLEVSRESLRKFLTSAGVEWCEDPCNEDDRFLRSRVRKAGRQLDELGLDQQTLIATADRMKQARFGLEVATRELANRVAEPTRMGSVLIDLEQCGDAPAEIRLRLLAHALKWVSGSSYRPRLAALLRFEEALNSGLSATLSGCIAVHDSKGVAEVCREVSAMNVQPATSGVFDVRWRVIVPEELRESEVRPLGEPGLRFCPEWKCQDSSRMAVMASPSIWLVNELISAPLAGMRRGCDCFLENGVNSFFRSIVTH